MLDNARFSAPTECFVPQLLASPWDGLIFWNFACCSSEVLYFLARIVCI